VLTDDNRLLGELFILFAVDFIETN
jgi:hypothetical protein